MTSIERSTRPADGDPDAEALPGFPSFFRWLADIAGARTIAVMDRDGALFRTVCRVMSSSMADPCCYGLLPGDVVAGMKAEGVMARYGFASLHDFYGGGMTPSLRAAVGEGKIDLLLIQDRGIVSAQDLAQWLPSLSAHGALLALGPANGLPAGRLRDRPWVDLAIAGGCRVTAAGSCPTARLCWLTGDVAARPMLRRTIEALYGSIAPPPVAAPASSYQILPSARGSLPVALRPGAEIEIVETGGFRSTGIDPQFWIEIPPALRAGWAFLAVDVEASDPPLTPVVYIFGAAGVTEYRYPATEEGRVEILIRLPRDISALRFDPLDQPGTFTLGKATLRPVGIPRLLAHLRRRDGALFGEIVRLYRTGGREAATARMLAIYNRADEFHNATKALQQAAYVRWVEAHDTLDAEDGAAIRRHIADMPEPPLISVVMPVYNTPAGLLKAAIESVLAQLYPRWELCIADDRSTDPLVRPLLEGYARRDRRIRLVFRAQNGHIAAASNSALELATGAFVALLDHDDVLPPQALYMVAAELERHPDADILYSDEDKIDGEGQRHDPSFKSDWDLDRFLSQNMLNHLGVFRTSLMREIGGFRRGVDGSQDYDLALRAVGRTAPERIRHIPFVLYHWRIFENAATFSSTQMDNAVAAARRALVDHLAATGQVAEVGDGKVAFWHRVRWPVPDPSPAITLIVPTRDRLELLKSCVEGLLERTDYANLDVLVADNDSAEPATLAYFKAMAGNPRFSTVRIPGAFNFSAINNVAVARARGSLVAFINNDIEVIEPGWLKEMVSHAIRPGVGAVGARLLYADGSVQHAGISLGTGGIAGHYEKYARRTETGYLGQLAITRNVSGVTAACLVMAKLIFEEVGGFDAENLSVAFNDVDLCLRIRAAGYRIVWTPYAELYHLESVSRGSDLSPEKAARFERERDHMERRWGETLTRDPYLSPNISLRTEGTEWAMPPRVERPWSRFRDDG